MSKIIITILYGHHTFDDQYHSNPDAFADDRLGELFLKTISTVYYIQGKMADKNETKRSVPYDAMLVRLIRYRPPTQNTIAVHTGPDRGRLVWSGSDGRLDSKAFAAVVVAHVDAAAAVVSSTHAVLLALQVQVVRRRRVPLAQRVSDDAGAAAVLFQEPLVVVRPVDRAHHRVDGGRALLGRPPPAVLGSPRPVGLAPQAHHSRYDGDREQHHRRATQHANVHQVHAVPTGAVGRILVEAHRAVCLTVAPELRANTRVQFRAPVNTHNVSPDC